MRTRRSVDLPQPDPPVMKKMSPGMTSKLMSFMSTKEPYPTLRWRQRMTGVAEEETGEMDMTRFTPYTPSTLQMTVMMAVATMMPTMACTTAVVVASPTAWALRPQWMP